MVFGVFVVFVLFFLVYGVETTAHKYMEDVCESCRYISLYMDEFKTTPLRRHWNDGSDRGNDLRLAERFGEVNSYHLSSYKSRHPGIDRITIMERSKDVQINLTQT